MTLQSFRVSFRLEVFVKILQLFIRQVPPSVLNDLGIVKEVVVLLEPMVYSIDPERIHKS
jgi:hypothetical protein